MRFSSAEVAAAVAGVLHGDDAAIEGVAIDSRRVGGGELFVPIVAERDGHDFITAAIERGAAAHLTGHPVEAGALRPAIAVADTSTALLEIGRLARSRLPDRVVGITGSVGKTSTKDLLAAVLGRRFVTAASARSFNNELGVPLTLANAPDATEAMVIEMGARGPGHIALLCDVARPTVGIVTTVIGAHLEMFGSIEAVARAKAELIEGLPATGTAVLNGDDPRVAAMAERATASVLHFGEGGSDVRATGVTLDPDLRASFDLVTPWGSARTTLAAHGRHQVVNALAAATAALVLGVDLDDVVAGLASAPISAMRMDLVRMPNGAVVLDDAYNANPTSMQAALDALATLDADRRVAMLGTMAELGADGPRLHREVAAYAARLGIRVVAVGEAAYAVDRGDMVDDVSDALDLLGDLGTGDVVLVKGSRVAALERLVAGLHGGQLPRRDSRRPSRDPKRSRRS